MNTFAHICSFSDPCNYRIAANGEEWVFDWSDRFGPSVIGRRGEILSNQPAERSRFWIVVSWWARQGKRVGDDGLCVYEIPTYSVRRIGKRTYIAEEMYQSHRANGTLPELEQVIMEQPL